MENDYNENENELMKRGRPKGSVDTSPRKKRSDKELMVQPGDNARITQFNLSPMQLPEVDRDDRSQVEKRILDYFKMCIDNDIKPGVAGICLSLGITRSAWQQWGVGKHRPGYSDIVEKSRIVMEAIMEQYMLSGKINPVTGIFLLKNNFGYADKSEVVLTPNNDPMGENRSPEYLKQKYLDATYGMSDNDEPDSSDSIDSD